MRVIGALTEYDHLTSLANNHFYGDTESSCLTQIPKLRRGRPPPVKDFTLAVGSFHHPRPEKDTLDLSVLSIYYIVAYCLTCLCVVWMHISLVQNTKQWIHSRSSKIPRQLNYYKQRMGSHSLFYIVKWWQIKGCLYLFDTECYIILLFEPIFLTALMVTSRFQAYRFQYSFNSYLFEEGDLTSNW